MIRSFLPIGQGNFAVERFYKGEYNVVFDCGSSTKIGKGRVEKTVEDQIRRTFHEGERIKKVFISHLHDDHINGLPFLLKYCNVEEIYLPYMTPSEKAIALILLHDSIDDRSGPLLQQLLTGQRLGTDEIETRVIFVLPNQSELPSNNETTVRSGQEIHLNLSFPHPFDEWLFIPFVYEDKRRSAQFSQLLIDNGIATDIQDRILTSNFWEDPDLLKKLKDVYSAIVKNINLTTMVVWSGTKEDDVGQCPCKNYYTKDFYRRCKYPECHRVLYKSGCLYTGDYRASTSREWDAMRRAYNEVWDMTGVFTIPHHGSSYNYNEELVRNHAVYIINAGYQNSDGHPSQSVLCHLMDSESTFFWVNEHVGSGVSFRVQII